MATLRHTVTALVEDRPGVLNRIASLFRRRSFNIESIVVGRSETPGLSRLTLVVGGDEAAVEQVTKQLYKLIDVVKVSDITNEEVVARELALVKVRAMPPSRGEIIQLVNIFRGDIVDVAPEALVIEVTGDEEKIEALLELLRPFGVIEVMRSGRVALARG